MEPHSEFQNRLLTGLITRRKNRSTRARRIRIRKREIRILFLPRSPNEKRSERKRPIPTSRAGTKRTRGRSGSPRRGKPGRRLRASGELPPLAAMLEALAWQSRSPRLDEGRRRLYPVPRDLPERASVRRSEAGASARRAADPAGEAGRPEAVHAARFSRMAEAGLDHRARAADVRRPDREAGAMKICGSCGGAGHNVRTCGRHRPAPGAAEVMIEPPPVCGPDLSWRPMSLRLELKRLGRECLRCARPVTRVGRCEWHYWLHRQQQRAYLKRRRLKAKVNGTCVHCYRRPAAQDCAYCEVCEPKVKAYGHDWSRSRTGRASKADSQRRVRAERADLGLCLRCDEPSHSRHDLLRTAPRRAQRPFGRSSNEASSRARAGEGLPPLRRRRPLRENVQGRRRKQRNRTFRVRNRPPGHNHRTELEVYQ
jgi:hypothetical protein